MLIYEKDNKLNISFENNMDETDIVVGKDEVKIGDSTISDNNVLPVAAPTDAGKVPTVQEDGSYALANAGGGGAFIVTDTSGTLNKTWAEISVAAANSVVIVKVDNSFWFMYAIGTDNESTYSIFCMCYVTDGKESGVASHTYTATTENGYPALGG